MPLIAAPQRAFAGDFDRGWLLAVQLYGVRSIRNWGMGDFTDLENLIELADDLGAEGVGLNPLHALFDDRPGDCSPYSPNSRLFLNALYIDVEKIPEFAQKPFTESGEITPRLRQSETVDYVAVARIEMARAAVGICRFQGQGERRAERGFCKIPHRARRAVVALRLF